MEVANEPPRAYVPSQPAVKSSQPQVAKWRSEIASTDDFDCKVKHFFGKLQGFTQIFCTFAAVFIIKYTRERLI